MKNLNIRNIDDELVLKIKIEALRLGKPLRSLVIAILRKESTKWNAKKKINSNR
jgi:plasmid stability protein